MNVITIVFLSLHSNGNYLCQGQFSAPTAAPSASPSVTPFPSAAPTCEKCVGEKACASAKDQSKIGCGSCMGFAACYFLGSDVTIGGLSCVGDYACMQASGELGVES